MGSELVFSDSTAWRGALEFWLTVYAILIVCPAIVVWLAASRPKNLAAGISLAALMLLPLAVMAGTYIDHLRFVELCRKIAGVHLYSPIPSNVRSFYLDEADMPFEVQTSRGQICLGSCWQALRNNAFDFVELRTDGVSEGRGALHEFSRAPAESPECARESVTEPSHDSGHQGWTKPFCIVKRPISELRSNYGARVSDKFISRNVREIREEIYKLNGNEIIWNNILLMQIPSGAAALFIVLWRGDAGTTGSFSCGVNLREYKSSVEMLADHWK
ncbi:MAG: hypothetical protein P4L72_01840 [Parvibaculum sp.]|uniref:hypothetical protein n=1 Tax=Parvibaculum sp. TaxID=2024848 RepID=UPI002844096D|nr:hypothetical protein [Parvibaculum sp.]MDR3497949.1 hypothetical protein [Parvibaculum sp.]